MSIEEQERQERMAALVSETKVSILATEFDGILWDELSGTESRLNAIVRQQQVQVNNRAAFRNRQRGH